VLSVDESPSDLADFSSPGDVISAIARLVSGANPPAHVQVSKNKKLHKRKSMLVIFEILLQNTLMNVKGTK
jgi:hypothetical protein